MLSGVYDFFVWLLSPNSKRGLELRIDQLEKKKAKLNKRKEFNKLKKEVDDLEKEVKENGKNN